LGEFPKGIPVSVDRPPGDVAEVPIGRIPNCAAAQSLTVISQLICFYGIATDMFR
jgi:hypothetical protein